MSRLKLAVACLLLASCSGGGGGESSAPPRVEAAGSIDTSFGVQGFATFPGRAAATAVVELDDGSLLVGGNGPYLAKLTASGALDPSFANGGVDALRRGTKTFQGVEKIEALSSGRVMVVEGHYSACVGSGFFCAVQSFRDVVARRIDAHGQPDVTYGEGGMATLPFSQGSVVVSADGRVTSFTIPAVLSGPAPFAVASLDAAGARDAAFESRARDALMGCGARFTPAGPAVVSKAAARSGSGFVVATQWSGGTCLARLNADGTLDASFGAGGFQLFPTQRVKNAYRVLVRSDGGIVVVLRSEPELYFEPPVFLFATATGARDTATAPDGVQAMPILEVAVPREFAVQANGKVVATGVNSAASGVPSLPLDEAHPLIARSTPNVGVVDFGFGPFRGGYMPLQGPLGAILPEAFAFGRDGTIFVAGTSGGSGAVAKIR